MNQASFDFCDVPVLPAAGRPICVRAGQSRR